MPNSRAAWRALTHAHRERETLGVTTEAVSMLQFALYCFVLNEEKENNRPSCDSVYCVA